MTLYVKKQAREEIATKLRHEAWEIQAERNRNRREINRLSDQQRLLKKKAVELRRLIRLLECKVDERT